MRPNVAQDAPPTSIEVGGFSYNIDTDFRTWLEVMRLMRQLSWRNDSQEAQLKFVEQFEEIEVLVFGGVLEEENPIDVIKGISDFLKGYPSAPMNGSGSGSNEKTYSFEYDLNEIIIAIWNQHHVNLMWNGEKCHWWMFLLYFRTLCGEHIITNLMSARSYKGKDKEMLKRKSTVSLPNEYTADEQAEIDAFNDLFETEDDEQTQEEQ